MTADDHEDLSESPKTIAEALKDVKITTMKSVDVKMADLLADPVDDHRYLQIDDAMKRQLHREFKQNQHNYYNNDPYRSPDPREVGREMAQVFSELAQEVRWSNHITTRVIEAMETISKQTAEILDKYITDLAIANKSTDVWRVRYEALLEHQGG